MKSRQLWTLEAEVGGGAALMMTGVSYRVTSAKENPKLTGKVEQRCSAEVSSTSPEKGGDGDNGLSLRAQTFHMLGRTLGNTARRCCHTHITTANPIDQSFSDTVLWSREARRSNSSPHSFVDFSCIPTPCVYSRDLFEEGIAPSTFKLSCVYLIHGSNSRCRTGSTVCQAMCKV